MEPNGYQFPQIVISSGEKGGVAGWECFWRRFVRRKAGLAGRGARSKHTPRTDPSTPWMALPSGCIALWTSSLPPFHRFLRPTTRNLSPADTYPL